MTTANCASDITIQISIDDEKWRKKSNLEALCQRSIDQTKSWLIDKFRQPFPKVAQDQSLELSVLFTSDANIQVINSEWRNINKPTNVLSFPSSDLSPGDMPLPILGDLVFAYETIEREAQTFQISFEHHLTHLIVHGFLHLFGYDHMDEDEAEKMEAIETGILESLGLSNPYNDI